MLPYANTLFFVFSSCISQVLNCCLHSYSVMSILFFLIVTGVVVFGE